MSLVLFHYDERRRVMLFSPFSWRFSDFFLQEIYLEEKEIDVDYLGALIGVPLLTKKFHF